MERKDLRKNIIPTKLNNKKIYNSNEFAFKVDETFDTTDLIYIDSADEQFEWENANQSLTWTNVTAYRTKKLEVTKQRIMLATDYAKANRCMIYDNQKKCAVMLRTNSRGFVDYITSDGDSYSSVSPNTYSLGVCPSFRYKLPEDKEINFEIKEVRVEYGKIINHILEIAEYPKDDVGIELNKKLESLYHNGEISDEMKCTGRWYSRTDNTANSKEFGCKHNPEFEYNNKRYVRVIENEYTTNEVSWNEVEPISCVIRNWDALPKNINPNGTGEATYIELRTQDAIIGGIEYYPTCFKSRASMWQNSMVRGFLNGIDVRNITVNENLEIIAEESGDFTGECNFLNEAFNLTREPMVEYSIPKGETKISDNAFNGCITLEKLTIHPEVESVGQRAFNGLNFKCAYKLKTGEMIFSKEILLNCENVEKVIDFESLKKQFLRFDYGVVFDEEKLNKIIKLSKELEKHKFIIPYVYADFLVDNCKDKEFIEKSDFRFFNGEFRDINEKLLNFSEKESLNFYKLVEALGCFNTDKVLDKNGNETNKVMAQQATSALATLLKTEEMQLRSI